MATIIDFLEHVTDRAFNGSDVSFYSDKSSGFIMTGNSKNYLSMNQSKHYGTSLYQNGTNAWTHAWNSDKFAFGSRPFTIEGWFYFPSRTRNVTSVRPAIITNYQTTSTAFNANKWYLAYDMPTAPDRLTFHAYNLHTSATIMTSGVIARDTWVHIAFQRIHDGRFQLYLNGVLNTQTGIYTATINPAAANNVDTRLFIGSGCNNDSDAHHNEVFINDIRITKDLARYSPIRSSEQIPDELDQFEGTNPSAYIIETLLPMDEGDTANENINVWGNSSAVFTYSGGIRHSLSQSKGYTSSMYFDGVNDDLRSASNSNFGFGSGSWTVEAWIYPTSEYTSANNVFDFRSTGSGSADGFNVYIATDGRLSVWNNTTNFVGGSAIPLNAWTHIAVVYDSTSNQVFGFVDGVVVFTAAATFSYSASHPCRIGASYAPNDRFNGYIQDARVVKGRADYLLNYGVPTAEPDSSDPLWNDVSLNLRMNGSHNGNTFVDDKGHTVNAIGSPITSEHDFIFGGSSLYTGRSGSNYLSVPHDDEFNLAGDFTIEGWFKFEKEMFATSTPNFLISKYRSSASTGSWRCAWVSGSHATEPDTLVFGCTTTGSDWIEISSRQVHLKPEEWYHIAIQRSGGYLTFFVDGQDIGTKSFTATPFISTEPVVIGDASGGTRPTFAYIDDVRITSAARYTSRAFTPAEGRRLNEKFREYDKTVLLVPMASSGRRWTHRIRNSRLIAAGLVSIIGNAGYTDERYKYYGSSLKVQKTASIPNTTLYCSDAQQYHVSLGDYTIEVWFNIQSHGTSGTTLISTRSGNRDINGFEIRTGNTSTTASYLNLRLDPDGGAVVRVSTSTIANNTWYHFALVRSNGNVYSYLNGVQYIPTASMELNHATFDSSAPLSFGVSWNNRSTTYEGTVFFQDFRLTCGVARYTSNFTPPGPLLHCADEFASSARVLLIPLCFEERKETTRRTTTKIIDVEHQALSDYAWAGSHFNGEDSVVRFGDIASDTGRGDFTFHFNVLKIGESVVSDFNDMYVVDFRTHKRQNELSIVITGASNQTSPSKMVVRIGGVDVITSSVTIPNNLILVCFLVRKDGVMRLLVNRKVVGEHACTNSFNLNSITTGARYESLTGQWYSLNGYMVGYHVTLATADVVFDDTSGGSSIIETVSTSKKYQEMLSEFDGTRYTPVEFVDNNRYSIAAWVWGVLPMIGLDGATLFLDFGPSRQSLRTPRSAKIKTIESSPYGVAAYFDGIIGTAGSLDSSSVIAGTSAWNSGEDIGWGMEFYMNPDVLTTAVIVDFQENRSQESSMGIRIRQGGSPTGSKIVAQIGDANWAAYDLTLTSTSSLAVGSWTHVSLNKVGSTITLYINGVAEASGTGPARIAYNKQSTAPFGIIGNNYYSYNSPYKGYMYDLIIQFRRPLRTESFDLPGPIVDISHPELSNQSHDPLYKDYVKAVTRQHVNDSFIRARLYPNLNVGGNGVTTSNAQRVGPRFSLVYLNDSGTSYYTGSIGHTEMNINPGDDFCVEYWYMQSNTSAVSNGMGGHFESRTRGVKFQPGRLSFVQRSDNRLLIKLGGQTICYSASGPTHFGWMHIAFGRQNGRFFVKRNGVLMHVSRILNDVLINEYGWWIGRGVTDSTGTTYGTLPRNSYFDQIRFINGIIPPGIAKSVPQYHSILKSPVEIIGETRDENNELCSRRVMIFDKSRNGLMVYSEMSGAGSDDPYFKDVPLIINFDKRVDSADYGIVTALEQEGSSLLNQTDVILTASQSVYGTNSAYFDGTSHIKTGDTGAFMLGESDFTIEIWVRPASFGVQRYIIGGNHSAFTTAGFAGLALTTSGVPQFFGNTTARLTSSVSISLNTWTHIAVTRRGDVTRMFVGGVLRATTTVNSISQPYTNSVWYIGYAGVSTAAPLPFHGHMNGFRLTKSSRYWDNFIPSTNPWPITNSWPVGKYYAAYPGGSDLEIVALDDNVGVTYDAIAKSNEI